MGQEQATVALDAVRMRAQAGQVARKEHAADRANAGGLAVDHQAGVVAPQGRGEHAEVLDSGRRDLDAGQHRTGVHQGARLDVRNGVTMSNRG